MATSCMLSEFESTSGTMKKNWCPISYKQPLSAHHKTETFAGCPRGHGSRAAPSILFIPDHDTLHNCSRCRVEELVAATFQPLMVVSRSLHESLHFCQAGTERGKPSSTINSGNTNKPKAADSCQ